MAGRRRKKMRSLAETMRASRRVSSGPDEQQPESDHPTEPDEQQPQSDLPTELLEQIFSHLTLRDNIRASAVSKRWLAAAISVRKADKSPWLMFFPKAGDLYEFYDPSQRKTYCLELPELRGSRICFAKDGWLLLFKPRTRRVFFFCPYTRELIKLPKLQLAYQIVAFSAAPTSPSCIIFTVKHITPTVVAVSTCHPGETEWDTIVYPNHLPFVSSIWNKLVFCNGLFYCMSLTGLLGVYDTEKRTWSVLSVPPPECREYLSVENWWRGKFMAEHSGDVFVICTCAADNPIIYKLDQVNKVWVQMETLGGMTIFASFLSCHTRTDLLGKMRNNVYFSKVLFYGKRCVTYSPAEDRYYPRRQFYDWGEQDPFESIWIDSPEDLSAIL